MILVTLALGATTSACGDDGESVAFFDAGSPDATPEPDAEVCNLTMCGAECVNTSNDPRHCGGCNMACDSPGQICSGALPCACPPQFVPASLSGSIQSIMGVTVGAYIDFAGPNLATIGYDPAATTLDTPIALTGAATLPNVGAGYQINVSTFIPHTAYLASSGTIEFDTACAAGITGTLSDVVLTEVDTATGALLPGGCTLTLEETVPFSFGGACP